jgi:MSHA biogenesis protein MshP
MCHKKSQQLKRHIQGSALVIAIFILVVMSLIGMALVRMQGSSSEAIAYDVVGTRAYAAAQTGIQWQLTQAFPLNNAPPSCTTVERDLSSTEGFDGCFFKGVCDSFSSDDNSTQYFTITSVGICNVADINTSRKIKVEAKSIK